VQLGAGAVVVVVVGPGGVGTGAPTVKVALAVPPVPPLAELTAPVVLVKVPALPRCR
jgi:hypothetical protein